MLEKEKKFKVNDTVRRINDEHGSMNVGDESIVIGYKNVEFNKQRVLLKSDKNMELKYSHKEENLEFVK